MDRIIKKCKCGIYLTINKHRDYYDTAQKAIEELNERGVMANNPEKEIDDELAKRMIETDCIYELQFYPDTPVGFIVVYGTSLEEVVKKANNLLA
jgi:hypothetical protein